MSSDDKKIWKKPDLHAFANADEAIAYYSERGMHEHVAAIKKLVEQAKLNGEEAEERRARVAARR